MAVVDILVAGRSYQLACKPEDEPNLLALARTVDAKAAQARQVLGGGASEGRMLLLTAMMLADEIEDLRGHASADVEAERNAAARDAQIASAIESIAERLESLGKGVEAAPLRP